MNRYTLFLVAVVTFDMVTMSSGAGIPEFSKFDKFTVIEKPFTAQEIQDKIMVTPFSYKRILLQNGERKVDCWFCSQPCPSTLCCDDGWPQCCTWQGLCGCCSV